MKVYVVTGKDHDNTTVVAAFSSRAEADKKVTKARKEWKTCDGVEEKDFTLNKKGIFDAIRYGIQLIHQ